MSRKKKRPDPSLQPPAPGLRYNLGPGDPEMAIAEIVMQRKGADQAITIEGIANLLWPNAWWFISNDSTGHPRYPHRAKIQRNVKGCISHLVRTGDRMIVSNRGASNPGYYVPVRREEVDRAVRTFVRQAVQMLSRAHKLTGDPRYNELAGQATLFSGDSPIPEIPPVDEGKTK
jgi:hypothetical protein